MLPFHRPKQMRKQYSLLGMENRIIQNIHKFIFLSQSTKYPEVRECALCITVGLKVSTQPGTPQVRGVNGGMEAFSSLYGLLIGINKEACAFLTI